MGHDDNYVWDHQEKDEMNSRVYSNNDLQFYMNLKLQAQELICDIQVSSFLLFDMIAC